MKPFVRIAEPHEDIMREKLPLDVFAANLWSVHMGDAPAEYRDPEVFFRKTYMTRGLRNIMDIVGDRLEGRGGDPVIQLQTPFGGGKTHTLISLYHRAAEMGARTVVLAGDALDASETTLWAEMERQLRGEVRELSGMTSPGMDKIKRLLDENQPVLILIDELLEYTVKASGVTVGESTLAAQLLAFMQELSQAASSLERVALVVTLPSSSLEHYDESAERMFHQLTKILGRTEKIFTPVEDDEIYSVIRTRLFRRIDESAAAEVIETFIEKAESEGILPEGIDAAEYREVFRKSYPFQPEVIDVLYERWGSFPEFQRTRGVLRLLAMVVNQLRSLNIPVIRLSDFPLDSGNLKREFLRFTGSNFQSIIASDITSPDAGARIIDHKLKGYEPYRIGTRIATSIFLYSFSGGGTRNGATIRDIKMACLEPEIPMSIIDEALNSMIERLFYIHRQVDLYYFSGEANLNSIVLRKKENIKDEDVTEEERRLLGEITGKKIFSVYIWPSSTSDVPDDMKLKLVIPVDSTECSSFLEAKGGNPRVYRNTMIFLVEDDAHRHQLVDHIKTKLAWMAVESDRQLSLTDEQKREVRERIKALSAEDREKIRNLYRIVLVPSRAGLERLDLGMASYGADIKVDYEIKSKLMEEDKLLESMEPVIIERRYLEGDYIETERILKSLYTTPGAMRITSPEVLGAAIRLGVRRGLFGLGVLDGEPNCTHLNEDCTVSLKSPEIIVNPELCEKCPPDTIEVDVSELEKLAQEERATREILEEYTEKYREKGCEPERVEEKLRETIAEGVRAGKFRVDGREVPEFAPDEKLQPMEENGDGPIRGIELEFRAPLDNMFDIIKIKRTLSEDFSNLDAVAEIRIVASDGEMKEEKYDRILETFEQLGIELKIIRR
ncbi:ATP-binding protein [Methanothermobacter sp. K4]|uniref:ATP-binding protein n=1 Tax=Methanothermobacter sp. K4 TaxID=2913262 RepID=UPI001EDB11E3|nr:DUF499 domain-containing protein [Methanothermobacter sp. K4]MCG2828535.1 DUF499 domain-containing protein [Methanothermobacter sp. K4]